MTGLLERLELEPVSAALLALLIAARFVSSLRSATRPARRGPGRVRWLDAGLTVVGCWLLVIQPFIVRVDELRSPVMAPTLRGSATPLIDGVNDRLVTARYLTALRPLRRGEIVSYRSGDGSLAVGRVVGLPGEVVGLRPGGRAEVDGRELDEPYARGGRLFTPPAPVPAESYFVVADDRDRDWPPEFVVPQSAVRGKVIAIVWPPARAGLL